MKSFEDFGLSSHMLNTIKKLGFVYPTEIQQEAIPYVLNDEDVVGESATGSGKTLAFGSGIIENIDLEKGLQALVLTPTRELAEQVKNSLIQIANSRKTRITAIYGGVSINPQISALQKANVVVATPGRLLDHLSRGTINLSNIKFFVLDEADRMFDMGFIDDVEKIIKACPKERQTLFFSATISHRVKQLANKYMKNPKIISVQKNVDPRKLKQIYYDVRDNMKLSLLVTLLSENNQGLSMIFCNTRKSTDFVAKNLKANGISASAIHGGLSQASRSKTLKAFDDTKTKVLVCTDVAARGLDISHVATVYNYNLPKDPTDYIHRIGRTARAGKYGKVVNLLSSPDHDFFSRILRDHSDFNIEREIMPKTKRITIVSKGAKEIMFRRKKNLHRSRRIKRY